MNCSVVKTKQEVVSTILGEDYVATYHICGVFVATRNMIVQLRFL